MIYLSASSIKDVLNCNALWYLRTKHKDKMEKTPAIVRGEIVHDTLEKSLSREDGINYAKNLSKVYNISTKDAETVDICIEGFYDNFYELLGDDDLIETTFKFKYSSNVTIIGRWDRISNGTLWDWKTGKRVPTSIDKDPQFILYHQAYIQTFGEEPNGIYYGALQTGKAVKFNPVPANIEIFFDEVIPTVINIVENGMFMHNGLFNGSCYNCLYRTFCHKSIGLTGEDLLVG